MNAVGIDVSKGISTVAVIRPFGEIIKMPFDVIHTQEELKKLAKLILSFDGETRVIMENTGKYHQPIANALVKAGVFVSVINAKLAHDYGGDTIRRAKTDKIDSLKIAAYCLDKWVKLEPYEPEDEIRKTLKTYNHQLAEYNKLKLMLKNNLISLLDQVFLEANELFTSPARESDGHEKWIDFALEFWHCECISGLNENVFTVRYHKWCSKNKYQFSSEKAQLIYATATKSPSTLPKNEFIKTLMQQAILQLNSLCQTIAILKKEMNKIASQLPEYATVLAMHGVGNTLAPQLIAEIGDVRRFEKRTSISCFAGIEPPENQSGKYEQKSRHISKQGSPHLRRALFCVMMAVLQNKSTDEPTFQFLDRKRAEGKPYKVYMIAGANKFLRIYYSRVTQCLGTL